MVGLGTFLADEGDVRVVVREAILNYGYRHVDTAYSYKNEEAIGDALQDCFKQGIRREDLFIVTKLDASGKDNVEEALRESLKNLKLDYVDLYLIHWMVPEVKKEGDSYTFKKTPTHVVWKQLEAVQKMGLTKSIGVSNCTIPLLIDILTYCEIKPVMNQIECHPYNAQPDVLKLHAKLGIGVTAYSPIGAGGFEDRPP